MGLRINTNIAAVTALRNLSKTDKQQLRSLERLSTGLRINRASDDPSGLVISEQLRAEIGSLRQAVENSEFASNLIGTTEAALSEMSGLLTRIRQSAIFALNTGGTSREQVAAEQDSVDSAIAAIERIADTTRFASTQLLNGASGFRILSQDTGLLEVNPISLVFDPTSTSTTYNVNVTSPGTQASILASGGTGTVASGGPVTLRLTGPLGTEDIVLAAGADVADFANAVNLLRGSTGIYASGSHIYSESFGSSIRISLEQIGGTGTFTGAGGAISGIGDKVTASGSDAVANLDGAQFSADGNILSVTSTMFVGSIELTSNYGAPGDYPQAFQFTVERSGLLFQLNTEETVGDQHIIGLPNVTTAFLGTEERTIGGKTIGGFLNSIRAGGANDLFNNPGNVVSIVDAAISDISNVRAYLGAFVNDTIEPNIASLNIAIENLVASESEIRDLDFASETAEFTRAQILFQAGTSVLAQANLIPQAVLRLIQ